MARGWSLNFNAPTAMPVHADVVDIAVLPQHQVLRVVLGQARADAAVDFGQIDFFFVADGFGGGLDGVDDFLVAGAAAQMRRQATFRYRRGWAAGCG